MVNRRTDGYKDYILKKIPVELWEAAQAKAASRRPPLAMRWVLIKLLERWVVKGKPLTHGEPATDDPPTDPPVTAIKKALRKRAPSKPRKLPAVSTPPAIVSEAPDLADSF